MHIMGIFSWLLPRSRPKPALHFHVYSRPGCHLCDVAWELLQSLQPRFGFALEKINVDDDPALAARYGEEVPVVTVNGRVRFRGGVNRVLLVRLRASRAP